MAEQLTPPTTDLEVWGSSLARRVASFNRQGTLLHCGSLHPGVEKGTAGILLGGGGGNPAMN